MTLNDETLEKGRTEGPRKSWVKTRTEEGRKELSHLIDISKIPTTPPLQRP